MNYILLFNSLIENTMTENDHSPKTPSLLAPLLSLGNTSTPLPSVTSTLIPLTENPAPMLTPIPSSAVTPLTPTLVASSTSSSISSAVKTTPRRKKELPSINFELEGEKFQKREKPSAICLKPEKSKTAVLLQKLLKDSHLSNEYEQLKGKCKLNPKLYGDEFKYLTSKISVKLQCLYDKWWGDIKKMEREILIKDQIVNDEDRKIYNEIKRNVAVCGKLKVIFGLNDPF